MSYGRIAKGLFKVIRNTLPKEAEVYTKIADKTGTYYCQGYRSYLLNRDMVRVVSKGSGGNTVTRNVDRYSGEYHSVFLNGPRGSMRGYKSASNSERCIVNANGLDQHVIDVIKWEGGTHATAINTVTGAKYGTSEALGLRNYMLGYKNAPSSEEIHKIFVG